MRAKLAHATAIETIRRAANGGRICIIKVLNRSERADQSRSKDSNTSILDRRERRDRDDIRSCGISAQIAYANSEAIGAYNRQQETVQLSPQIRKHYAKANALIKAGKLSEGVRAWDSAFSMIGPSRLLTNYKETFE